jgi:uncharacterized cupredoxin-like copper-binding protein
MPKSSLRLAPAVLTVVLLASCSNTEQAVRAPAPPDTGWDGAQTVTVKLSDFKFTPENLNLRLRAPVRLVLVNDGSDEHDFAAPAFFSAVMYRPGNMVPADGRIIVAKGATKEIDVLPVAAGTYDLECTEFLHTLFGMTGSITVAAVSG